MILSHPWTVRQLTPYFPVTPYMPLMPYFPVTPHMPLMPCINGPLAAMDPAATRVKVIAVAAGAPLAASPVALSAAPLAPPAALVAIQGAPAAISTGLPLIAINAHQQLPIQFAAAPHAAYVPMFGSVSTDVMRSANVRIDWKGTSEAHVGLKKEKVKVEVEEGRILQISGERRKEQEEKNDKCHRVERSSGKFHRPFPLPMNAKMEEVKASMENGVLTVSVSKMEEKKQRSTPLKSLVKKLKNHCCCFKAFPPLNSNSNSNSRKQTKMILRVKRSINLSDNL